MAKESRNGRKRSGNAQANNEGNGGVAVAEETTPFKYYVKGERPRADGAFFELLVIKVLEEKGDLPDFDEVWPRGAQALAGLNTLRLSQLTPAELESIIGTVGGEFASRLHNRINDLIAWADAFWTIRQIYGSFRQYVRSFDTDGYEALIGDLAERLSGLSANVIVSFLRDAGEKIPTLPQIDAPDTSGGRPAKQRSQRRQGRGSQGGRRRSGRGGNRAKGNANGEQNKNGQAPAQQQQKPAKANQEKGGGRNRRGRRGFFRRKRGGRPKAESGGKPAKSAADS